MDLFLMALLPPEPIRSDIWALKQEMHQRTGSRNAVNLPPHITLIPPLRQPASFAAAAAASLREFGCAQKACLVGLEDFAWFQSRTLYVHVAQAQAVQQLHEALHHWCAMQLPAVPAPTRPFVPHVTLATRDLPPQPCRSYAQSLQAAATRQPPPGKNWCFTNTMDVNGKCRKPCIYYRHMAWQTRNCYQMAQRLSCRAGAKHPAGWWYYAYKNSTKITGPT
ncbi:2'-5' RNA ligase family protein [Hymenobacter sp. 5516J-16]|uniref:2'-5' RNA ligase family protein n=1 Tax=Hymenobacter sp. 5516J-16 TaxID=2932253 RepID=UPI001FD1832E|nr:2'-5' RNA ligase family protein [Hymenobacter sp. 5516J-16]UOQ77079.1 2'-5' RNA ligase family protein [Hymenobacter sp. 5516J-16]